MRKIWRDNVFFGAAAAAAAALGAWQFLGGHVYSVQNFAYYADRGEILFHAILDKSVSYSMPLLSLLVSGAEYHSYLSPASLSRAAGLLVCLPAYAIGARGGKVRGALFALAAMAGTLGVASHEAEQVFYSFALLVFLAAELRRQESGGALPAAASGLSAAATLLIRSPLLAFPPLAAAWGWFTAGGKARRRLLSAALFLVCAYLPLVPWARLNQAVYGKFILFEQERSTCNLITGASGIVFTIEGDARAFAGLNRTESAYPWAVRKIMENPLNYLRAVARRLWQFFLFFPALFLLGAAGLWFARRDAAARFTAFLAGYFILLHCLLSIEERYFYPVRYLLALLAAGGAWAALEKYGLAAARKRARDRLTPALASLLALVMAVCLVIVWRFPGAARPGLIGVAAALKKYPGDPWLNKKLGETLLSYDLTGRGLAALGEACSLGGRPDTCWLAGATQRGGRPAPPPGVENRYELLLVKTLKELDLGLDADAAASFGEAQWFWLTERNRIKGVPYRSDEEHLRRIWKSNKTLWDTDLHTALLYWPPPARPGLLEKISRLTPLSPKLRSVQLAHKTRLSAAEEKELSGLKKSLGSGLQASEYDWRGNTLALTAELLRRGPEAPAGLEGELGLLTALPATPEEAADLFSTHSNYDSGAALRAAAEVFISSGNYRRRAARSLAAADPDNFAYSLILMKEEGFSPSAINSARSALKAHPFPLSAGAAAWAKKGGREETAILAAAAVKAGRLNESGWSLLLLALQEAGDYRGGVEAAGAALREHPGSSQLLNNRGVMNHLAGDSAAAVRDFRAAAAADNMNFSAQMNLGAALERAGDNSTAAGVYSFAVHAAGSEQDRRNAALAGARAQARASAGH